MFNPSLTWFTVADLANGANRLLRLGGGETVASPITVGDVRNTPNLRFSFFADVILTFELEESFDQTFTAGLFHVSTSLIVTANTYMTVYDLPAPRNETGFLTLTRPYLRVRLTNNGAAPSTVLRCWVSVRD